MQSRATLARRRRQTFALASIGVVAGAGVASGAASLEGFSDEVALTSNDTAAGAVVLGATESSLLVSFSGIGPGHPVTQALSISGSGPLDRVYSATSAGVITDATPRVPILVVIKSGVSTCSNAGFAANGAVVYSGTIGSEPLAAPAPLFGSRILPASSSELLCLQASLPGQTSETGSSARDGAMSLDLTFSSEAAPGR